MLRSLLLISVIVFFTQGGTVSFERADSPIKGLTFVAPPSPFSDDPFERILMTNSEWVAFVPYAFQRLNSPLLRFNVERQWWGEKEEGIRECIRMAHARGLKVMLKPQVYLHGSWPGAVDYPTEEDWRTWEEGYRAYIQFYSRIAAEEDVDMLCIGTEYKIAAQKRESFWRKLIKSVRAEYTGKLTYSANWDCYRDIPFWDDLDFIGISAYFPLNDARMPDEAVLSEKWKPHNRDLRRFAYRKGKPVLFTEYGYLSVDHCAGENWKLEKQLHRLSVNEEAQAVALNALYTAFWDEKYWAGGFLWKWYPNNQGHEGYPDKDYTPQDKLAEDIIKKWYSR